MSAWSWLDWPTILGYSGITLAIIVEIVTSGRDG